LVALLSENQLNNIMSTIQTLYLPSMCSLKTYIRAVFEKLTVGHLHNKFRVSTKKKSLSCLHNSLLRCIKFIWKANKCILVLWMTFYYKVTT